MEKTIVPDGRDFIFTIFDDTDVSTVDNVRPVYDFLGEIGMLTTKTVWPLHCQQENSDFLGSHTLQDSVYASFIRELSQKGFEIAYHGATMESSSREKVMSSLATFREILGFLPRSYACHALNEENLFWGEDRFTFWIFRKLYGVLKRGAKRRYSGHLPQSTYYWGDVCQEIFQYVRTFTFNDINLLNVGKFPYRVSDRECLNFCFFTSFADNVEEFNRLLSMANQEKLERERGVAIVTTHFGKGFTNNTTLNATTRKLLRELSRRNGHFVPVCAVLDHVRSVIGTHYATNAELFWLELRWFCDAVLRKVTALDYEKTETASLGIRS